MVDDLAAEGAWSELFLFQKMWLDLFMLQVWLVQRDVPLLHFFQLVLRGV